MNKCEHCGEAVTAIKGSSALVAGLTHFVECPKRPPDKALDANRIQLAKRRRDDKIADVVTVASAIAAAAAGLVAVLP